MEHEKMARANNMEAILGINPSFLRNIFFFFCVAQIHLDEALTVTSHKRGNVKDIASAFKGESRRVFLFAVLAVLCFLAIAYTGVDVIFLVPGESLIVFRDQLCPCCSKKNAVLFSCLWFRI